MSIAERVATSTAAERDARRAWIAIALATAVTTVGFWSVVYAFVTERVGDDTTPVAAAALGLAVMPLAFAILAFVSKRPGAPVAVVLAMLVAFVVGMPLLAIWPDVATGMVAAYGAGAAVALRQRSTPRRRFAAVAIVTVVEALLVLTVPLLALASGPALPLVAVGLADDTAIRRAQQAGTRT